MASTRRAEPEIHAAIAGLQRLAELFVARRAQLAREAGITEAQWRLLESVEEEDFLPSMFARERECTPAAISRTLRQLLDAELVGVSIDPEDGRQRRYRLTARGRRVLAKLREGRARAIAAVWQPLGKRELARFARFAETLADRLEEYAEDA